ncbi:hypothetical protein ACFSCW_13465 [Sphingomonas tabacisoli]|uniref:Uncharacterized protein n=1 Tax=Sphingomonas tabacisoli TaxID=2249466 RepID=A0ABW4I4A8_9SPHN
MKISTKITAGLLAGATLVAAASPAEAQYRYNRYYGHRGDRTGLALGAGALGLALGAAVASSNRGGYYGNRGYYGNGYYGGSYAYNDGYYGRPYGYGYGYGYAPRRCWTERQWDDWYGGWRRVRVCTRY